MRNGVVRVPAICRDRRLALRRFGGSGRTRAGIRTISLSAANGIFDILQRDMLVLKDRLGVMLSAIPQLPEIGPFLLRRLTKQYEPRSYLDSRP